MIEQGSQVELSARTKKDVLQAVQTERDEHYVHSDMSVSQGRHELGPLKAKPIRQLRQVKLAEIYVHVEQLSTPAEHNKGVLVLRKYI